MCKDGECLECMTIDRNQLSDYLDKIARFLIDSGSVKTDDMVQEEVPVYVVESVTALRERVAKLEESIKDAQVKLHATQRNWDEECLFECNDILTAALKSQ